VNFGVEISGFSEKLLPDLLINFFESVDLFDVSVTFLFFPDFENIYFV
jgi:hypothetical protein